MEDNVGDNTNIIRHHIFLPEPMVQGFGRNWSNSKFFEEKWVQKGFFAVQAVLRIFLEQANY